MLVHELINYLSKVSNKSKEICFYEYTYHITNIIVESQAIYLDIKTQNKYLSVRQLVGKLIALNKLHYKVLIPLPRDIEFIAEYSNMVLIGAAYQTIPQYEHTMLFLRNKLH